MGVGTAKVTAGWAFRYYPRTIRSLAGSTPPSIHRPQPRRGSRSLYARLSFPHHPPKRALAANHKDGGGLSDHQVSASSGSPFSCLGPESVERLNGLGE